MNLVFVVCLLVCSSFLFLVLFPRSFAHKRCSNCCRLGIFLTIWLIRFHIHYIQILFCFLPFFNFSFLFVNKKSIAYFILIFYTFFIIHLFFTFVKFTNIYLPNFTSWNKKSCTFPQVISWCKNSFISSSTFC